MAIDALSNQEKLQWTELEAKLQKALEFYNKTAGFDLIYEDSEQSNERKQ